MSDTLENQIKQAIITVENFPKPGVFYKDIAPLFLNATLGNAMVEKFYEEYKSQDIEAVLGLESRGFLIGMPLALKLGVPFILIRKKGKLPRETYVESYDLEYGSATIEMQRDALKPGQRVLIHDDVLATGGTASAAGRLVKQAGAEIAGFSFLVELCFLNGRKTISTHSDNIFTLAAY